MNKKMKDKKNLLIEIADRYGDGLNMEVLKSLKFKLKTKREKELYMYLFIEKLKNKMREEFLK